MSIDNEKNTDPNSLLESEEVLGMAASIAALMNEMVEIRSGISTMHDEHRVTERNAMIGSIDSIIELLPAEGRLLGDAIRECVLALSGLVEMQDERARIEKLMAVPEHLRNNQQLRDMEEAFELNRERRWARARAAVDRIRSYRTLRDLTNTAYKFSP